MAELQDELLNKCIVCGKANSKKNPCVKNMKNDDVSDMLQRCQLLKNSGDHTVSLILERLLQAKENKLLGSVRYHSECRKPIMHEKRKRSYSESSVLKTPAINYICRRDKSYLSSKPTLPKLEENGWSLKDTFYEPVRCVTPPAPKAVLELVKCGCRKKCSTNCSCLKNKLPCTALCKCYAWGCNSCSEFQKPQDDELEGEEEEQQ